MWIADKWTDFELLDCSNGEKAERWGDKLLIRPEPQAIWQTKCLHPAWTKWDGRYLRSTSGGGHWEKRALPDKWQVRYGDLTFLVGPMNFKHTGLFPEQATNWDFIQDKIRTCGRQPSILNLFAYTGGATLAAAAAGAEVCHVDAARGMVSWARENAQVSDLTDRPIRWIVDDCVKFVRREIRRGRRYDGIILDPPSYGRGPTGEVWKLEDQLYPFMELVSEVLSENALFVVLNAYTTGLSPATLRYISDQIFVKNFGGFSESRELGIPVTESGLCLPCGATCRWVAANATHLPNVEC